MTLLITKNLPKHVKYKIFLSNHFNSKSYIFLTKYYGIALGNREFPISALLTRISGSRITAPQQKLINFSAKIHTFIFFILEHFFEKKTTLWLKKQKLLNFTSKIAPGSFKMYRFKLGLPTNGQRIRTNRKTARKLNYSYLKLYGIVAN